MWKLIITCLFCVLAFPANAYRDGSKCEKSICNYEDSLSYLFGDIKNEKALANMDRLANNGDVRAMLVSGITRFRNGYKDKNFTLSQEWLLKAANKGDVLSRSILALINMEQAPSNVILQELITFANKGEGISQFYLGRLYTHGLQGVTEDRQQAAYWLTKAAKQGISKAGEYLSWIYYSMDDKSLNNIEEAMIWYHFSYFEEFYCQEICAIINPIIQTLDWLIPEEMELSQDPQGGSGSYRKSPIAVQVRYAPNYNEKNLKYLKKTLRPNNLSIYKAFDIRASNNKIISFTNRYM